MKLHLVGFGVPISLVTILLRTVRTCRYMSYNHYSCVCVFSPNLLLFVD
jgi:hypothetical protein